MRQAHLTLDLQEHIPDNTTVLNTRTWGIALRNLSNIEKLEEDYQHIDIEIPEHVTSISTVFLEEFLKKIIIKLRCDRAELLDRFQLISNSGEERFRLYLEDAIQHVTAKEKNAIVEHPALTV